MTHSIKQSIPEKYQKEIDLILLCARPSLDEKAIEQVRSLVKQDLDWEYLVDTAVFHRVHLLMEKNLETACPDVFQNEPLQKLRFEAKSNAARSLLFSNRLMGILDLLERHQIAAVPFKGPVLAERVYGAADLRQSVDLDILIHKNDAVHALRLLEEQGFIPEIDLDEKQFAAYAGQKNSIAFGICDSVLAVDLHWEMSGNYASEPLTLDLIRDGLQEVLFSGRNVLQPDDELLLIYLCLHGTRDCWRDLESLAGIAALIQSQNGCEWGRVMELADRMHCRRMLRLTLTLVFALFKVGLPQTIMIDIEKDPAVSKLAATMCQNLFDTDRIDTKAEPKTKFSRFHLKVRDSWPEKFRYLRHLIFGTTIQEWRYFPMPARFSFLYGLLRPLRLFVAFLVGGIKAGVRFRVSGARKKVT